MNKQTNKIEMIPIQIDSNNKTNLYIENSIKIPLNKVVYDFFNSGRLIVNYPVHMGSITGYKDTMQTIYTGYIIKDSFMKNPDYSSTVPTWTKRYIDDTYNGWIFEIDFIFDLTFSHIPVPVCKSFTGQTEGNVYHVSDTYLFANKQDTIGSNCSHPKVYVDKLVPHACVYNGQFSSCPFYQYDYDLIESFTVNPSTINSQVFELRSIKNSDNFITYQLFDLTNNQINYIIYEKDTLESKENAISVMREVLSSYQNFSANTDQLQNKTADNSDRKSYILSLT